MSFSQKSMVLSAYEKVGLIWEIHSLMLASLGLLNTLTYWACSNSALTDGSVCRSPFRSLIGATEECQCQLFLIFYPCINRLIYHIVLIQLEFGIKIISK